MTVMAEKDIGLHARLIRAVKILRLYTSPPREISRRIKSSGREERRQYVTLRDKTATSPFKCLSKTRFYMADYARPT
jgi:hypothetical protein